MTLRELINSVDAEHYSDSPLFQKELSADGFSAPEQESFWNGFDDLQKAKIIR